MRVPEVIRRSVPGPGLLLGAALEVFGADRRGTLVAVALQLVGATAALGVVGAAKLTFDALLTPGHGSVGLAPALAALALATGLTGAVASIQGQQLRMLGERVSQRVWDRLIERAARADLVTYEATGFATALERIQVNALTKPFYATAGLIRLVGGMMGTVTLSAALMRIEPLLVPVLLSAGLPAVLLSRWSSRAEFDFAHRMTSTARRRDYLRKLLTDRPYAAELRAFDAIGPLQARHQRLNATYMSELRALAARRKLIAVLTALAVAAVLAAALWAIMELVARGRIGLPEAGAAAIAVRLLSGQLVMMFDAAGALIESAPFLADLARFVSSGPEPRPPGVRRRLVDRVRLAQISFTYPEQRKPAVEAIDLEIRAGEIVALVGENGSGKTTLAKIVAGLYDPDRGQRHWDGQSLDAADLRASVSVIFQDFVRYQMTLGENIAISDGDRIVDGEAVLEAARRAGALSVVEDARDGMDTMLGRDLDEGVDLSGGQWQRIALARALHRNCSVVVLDEPSAALDPRSEHQLFSDVRAVLGGRAALLISHRFSSTRLADRIYVMDGGRIIESGTHEELMARAGQYAELYQMQSAGYR